MKLINALHKKTLYFDGSDESAKTLIIGYSQHRKSHSEMCMDIFSELTVMSEMIQFNLLGVSPLNCQPYVTLAAQFDFNCFPALSDNWFISKKERSDVSDL